MDGDDDGTAGDDDDVLPSDMGGRGGDGEAHGSSSASGINSTSSLIKSTTTGTTGEGDGTSSSSALMGSSPMGTAARRRLQTQNGPQVLVIEDDRSIAKTLSKQLRKKGYRCAVAGTLAEALAFVEGLAEQRAGKGSADAAQGGSGASGRSGDSLVALVTCDLNLPDGQGPSVVPRIRDICTGCGCTPPVVVGITGAASPEELKAFRDVGISEVCMKGDPTKGKLVDQVLRCFPG